MEQKPIMFLLKATKEKYVKSTLERELFCFSHPTIFSKWEDIESTFLYAFTLLSKAKQS